MDYQRIYNQIIERANNENRIKTEDKYYEAHHIVPQCMGGEGKTKDLNHYNIVLLTAREHFICHMLLCEIYPSNIKLQYALSLMAFNRNKKYIKYKISSRTYDRLKAGFIELARGRPKPIGFGDRLKSKERNDKIGKANSKPKPDGFGKNHSIKMKGIKKSQEDINKRLEKIYVSIIQLSLSGYFIREWKSTKHASDELGISSSGVSCCLRGKTKSAYGFVWVHKKKYNPEINSYKKIHKDHITPRKGKSLEIGGNIYNSINHASRELNISSSKLKYKIDNNKIKYKWL